MKSRKHRWARDSSSGVQVSAPPAPRVAASPAASPPNAAKTRPAYSQYTTQYSRMTVPESPLTLAKRAPLAGRADDASKMPPQV